MTSPACDGVVVFNYSAFIMQYPEFAAVSQPVAQSYFDRATIGGLIDNTPLSPIQDLAQRTILINLVVAHLMILGGEINPAQRQTVGRVSAAAQGSVNVSLDMPVKGGALAAYWNQTQYGAQYYASTLRFRTATYYPPPPPFPGPSLPRFGRWGRGF